MKHAHATDTPSQVERLRQLGVRVTPQRLLVLRALVARGGHMTAEEILRDAAAEFPAVNLATIYRSLDLLASLGIVTETDMGSGSTHYELAGAPHHHLVCERCGAVSEMDDDLFQELRAQLLRRYDFAANPRHLALFGLCAQCRL